MCVEHRLRRTPPSRRAANLACIQSRDDDGDDDGGDDDDADADADDDDGDDDEEDGHDGDAAEADGGARGMWILLRGETHNETIDAVTASPRTNAGEENVDGLIVGLLFT